MVNFFRRLFPSDQGRKLLELAHSRPVRLHVGSGQVHLKGWINIDEDPKTDPDVVWDLRKGLPLADGGVRLVYNEHFLEHLSQQDGLVCLREFRRVLEPDGILRVAMPDLETITKKYVDRDGWREQDWLTWPEYRFIQSRAEMLNVALRWWGHQYVYDEEELTRRLKEAGFARTRRCAWGESEEPDLRRLETRKDSLLIVEARP